VLATHFAQSSAKALGKRIEGISPESLRRLAAYDWPGNVRELRNVIERAVITSPGPLVVVRELGFGPEPARAGEEAGEPLALEENERRHLRRVLERTGWRLEGPGGAAELLQVNASTLRSRLKKLGIAKPARDISRPAVTERGPGPRAGGGR
jgi:DNA-binding NtrC family response regulator